MDSVKVSLPKPEDTSGKKIKSFLKQLELSIHHLQKSVEQMELDGELSENTYLMYRFPFLERKCADGQNTFEVHVDDLSDTRGMQDIEIEICTV